MVQIVIFVEDEKTFLTLTFMKIKLWNCLCEHLDLVVHMFAQPFHIVNTFFYDDAITTWINEKIRKGFLVSCFLINCCNGSLFYKWEVLGF